MILLGYFFVIVTYSFFGFSKTPSLKPTVVISWKEVFAVFIV